MHADSHSADGGLAHDAAPDVGVPGLSRGPDLPNGDRRELEHAGVARITAGMFSAFAGFFLYLMKRSRMAVSDVAAPNGLGVVCVRLPEGEQFTFIITDSTKVRELGFRAIETLMRESELRAQLALAGFPAPAVEESIQVARTWATSITTRRHCA